MKPITQVAQAPATGSLPSMLDRTAVLRRWRRRTVFLGILLATLAHPARADFDYADFSSVEGLNFVADAAQFENLLRVTPAQGGQAGAVWYVTKQNVENGFRTVFQFRISEPPSGGYDGGDGFAFLI